MKLTKVKSRTTLNVLFREHSGHPSSTDVFLCAWLGLHELVTPSSSPGSETTPGAGGRMQAGVMSTEVLCQSRSPLAAPGPVHGDTVFSLCDLLGPSSVSSHSPPGPFGLLLSAILFPAPDLRG